MSRINELALISAAPGLAGMWVPLQPDGNFAPGYRFDAAQFLTPVDADAVSVRRYGATGGSNDTVAFQAAIDDCASTGRAVYVPPLAAGAQWNVDRLFLRDNTRIIGSGRMSHIRLRDGSTKGIFFTDPGTPTSNIHISYLRLDGNKVGNPAGNAVIRCQGDYITCAHLWIHDCNSYGINVGYGVSRWVLFDTVEVLDPSSVAVHDGGLAFTRVQYGKMRDCRVLCTFGTSLMGNAFNVEPNAGYAASENGYIDIENCLAIGGSIQFVCGNNAGGYASPSQHFRVIGCTVDLTNGRASTTNECAPLVLQNVDRVTVSGCLFIDHPTSTSGSGHGLNADGATNVNLGGGTTFIVHNPAGDESAIRLGSHVCTGYASGCIFTGVLNAGAGPRFVCPDLESVAGIGFRFGPNAVTGFGSQANLNGAAGAIMLSIAGTGAATSLWAGGQYQGSRYAQANVLAAGGGYAIEMAGFLSQGGTGAALLVEITLGSVVLSSKSFVPTAGLSKNWNLRATLLGRTSGATGLVTAFGAFNPDMAVGPQFLQGTAGTAVDLTLDNLIGVRVSWTGSLSGSELITVHTGTIRPINT